MTEKVTEKVTEKELSLLKVILEDPGYTMEGMANQLSVSRKTISIWLNGLKNKGIVRRIGSTKTGHWEVEFYHSQIRSLQISVT